MYEFGFDGSTPSPRNQRAPVRTRVGLWCDKVQNWTKTADSVSVMTQINAQNLAKVLEIIIIKFYFIILLYFYYKILFLDYFTIIVTAQRATKWKRKSVSCISNK